MSEVWYADGMKTSRIAVCLLMYAAWCACALACEWAEPTCPPERAMPLDPVALIGGREVPGKPDLVERHEGAEYHFESEESRATFVADRAKYAAADGGACGSMGPLSGVGDARRATVHEGKLYFFASDGCKATFLKDPSKCIEVAAAKPTGDADAIERARVLLDRLTNWCGGAEALKQLQTLELTTTNVSTSGGKEWKNVRTARIAFPDRFAERDAWNDSWWEFVSTGGVGGSKSHKESIALAESRRAAFVRWMLRHPIVLLKMRDQPGFVAVAEPYFGDSGTGEARVDVWFAGALARIGIEERDGKLLWIEFVGRDESLKIGRMRREFTRFEVVNGVQMPMEWKRIENNEERKALGRVDTCKAGVQFDESVFSVAKEFER